MRYLLLSTLLLLSVLDNGDCCPKKFKGVVQTVADKFKLLKKPKGSQAEGLADQASGIKRAAGGAMDNPGCKNPFFPCTDPAVLGKQLSSVVKSADTVAKKSNLKRNLAIGAGAAGGVAVVAGAAAAARSGSSPASGSARSLKKDEAGGGEADKASTGYNYNVHNRDRSA